MALPGRTRLEAFASEVDPLEAGMAATLTAPRARRTTEVSKMKGQRLHSDCGGRLVAVNLSWIVYVMKDGQMRLINQNGADMLKAGNSSEAAIADLVLLGAGGSKSSSAVVALDRGSSVTLLSLDAKQGQTHEERLGRAELRFAPEGPLAPRRVLGHPSKTTHFALLHDSCITVWNRSLLGESTSQTTRGQASFDSFEVDDALLSRACCTLQLPPYESGARLLDAGFSVDGTCMVALTDSSILAWSLEEHSGIGIMRAKLVQRKELNALGSSGAEEFKQLRILSGAAPAQHRPQQRSERDDAGAAAVELLVLAAPQRNELVALELRPRNVDAGPIGALAQRVCLVGRAGAAPLDLLVVDALARDSLTISLQERSGLLVLPLALEWNGSRESGLPFPYVQHVYTEYPVGHLATMTGKSMVVDDHALFLYRARNFMRDDGKPGVDVAVDELESAVTARERARPAQPPGLAAAAEEPSPAQAPVDARLDAENAAGADVEPEPERAAADGDAAPDVLASASAAKGPGKASTAAEASEAVPPDSVVEAASRSEDRAGSDMELRSKVPGLISLPASKASAPSAPSASSAQPTQSVANAGTPPRASDSDDEAGSQPVDWGFVKQIAASYVKGLEKKRAEATELIVKEVTKAAKSGHVQGSDGLTASEVQDLEEALAKLREANEIQAANERALVAAARNSADRWAENAASSMSNLLQKELTRISDGAAGSLVQQLMQSRKFNDALAKGVQKGGGLATKQALEALRPAQLQEIVGAALGDALREALNPVFKQELRSHFEKDIAPLIAQRLNDMMAGFRKKMGESLDGIAANHEQAAQRLASELAPTLREELQKAQEALARRGAGASGAAAAAAGEGDATGLTDGQLEHIAATVQAEIVSPLQTRVQELSAQVRSLREEARQLQQRLALGAADRLPPTPNFGAPAAAPSPAELEEQQAVAMERQFGEGRFEEAFTTALGQQARARHVDFLGRVCALVPEPLYDWLEGKHLSAKLHGLLMVALSRQLATAGQEAFHSKVVWVQELLLTFEGDALPGEGARSVYRQLQEALEALPAQPPATATGEPGPGASELRQLRQQVRSHMRLLAAT
eukprot:TRINITY_DN46347_c0_g1_i1.p1 TRINITY_DN46347_c0_g1~~TRINITY_DN46347_c0_g1_i1.p1  ORF type:complete len:1128 (+),score=308.05 TRINITY_DN46347_c0_g1_i1:93-3386(+)